MDYIFSQDGTLKLFEEHKKYELNRKKFNFISFERICVAIRKRKEFLEKEFGG